MIAKVSPKKFGIESTTLQCREIDHICKTSVNRVSAATYKEARKILRFLNAINASKLITKKPLICRKLLALARIRPMEILKSHLG